MILVSWIKDLVDAAFFKSDEVGRLLATLVSAIEIASGLHVVFDVEDLAESVEELGLAGICSSIDDNTIALFFSPKNEELTDVFDEGTVFGVLNLGDGGISGEFINFQRIDILLQVSSNIWKFRDSMEVVIKILSHHIEFLSLSDSLEEEFGGTTLLQESQVLVKGFQLSSFIAH